MCRTRQVARTSMKWFPIEEIYWRILSHQDIGSQIWGHSGFKELTQVGIDGQNPSGKPGQGSRRSITQSETQKHPESRVPEE